MAGSAAGRQSQNGRGANRTRLLVVVAVALAFLAIGWAGASLWSGSSGIAVKSQLEGTVSVASASGANICIAPNGGGAEVCGVAYQDRDAPALVVGDRVRAALVDLKQSSDTAVEVLVVLSVGR